MSEPGDYTPATWAKGRDFKSAYNAYDKHAGRSYDTAKAAGKTASKLLPAFIETKSTRPMIVDNDFSGSMDGWDTPLCAKYPYLDHELRTMYLGADAEISIGAFADVDDEFPLQICQFANEARVIEVMHGLVHRSGGAGSDFHHEAHPLALLYRLFNTRMPNAVIKPPYILVTDEMPCSSITKEQAERLAKVNIEQRMTREEIFRLAKAKFALYVVIKPYGSERITGDELPPVTQEVYDCWKKIVGENHMAILDDPNRIVDVIFGILAKETGKIAEFREELKQRQLPDKGGAKKVATVFKSLETIHALPKPGDAAKPAAGHSKTKGLGGGKPTKSLLS